MQHQVAISFNLFDGFFNKREYFGVLSHSANMIFGFADVVEYVQDITDQIASFERRIVDTLCLAEQVANLREWHHVVQKTAGALLYH